MTFNTILVTGGAGFIGSNFIRFFIQRHRRVKIINLDNLVTGMLENLSDLASHSDHLFIKGDITDAAHLSRVFQEHQPDAAIHFAAATHVDKSIHEGVQVFIDTNITGTTRLLEAARKFDLKKFVHISTDEVYGALDLDEDRRFDEADRHEPNNPYAATKAGAEAIARAYQRTWGVPVVITRSSNNFGPYQHPEKLIPFFITRLLANKTLPLYGDGQHVRDWLHVEDNCRAVELCLLKGQPGEIYNIGAHGGKSNLEIARAALKFFGRDESLIEFIPDRPGHDRKYALDSSKIKRELGWEPGANFDEQFAATLQWYADHPEWLAAMARSEKLNPHIV